MWGSDTMRIIDRVEAEFGEPFAAVVFGLAAQGLGPVAAAEALGCHKSSFFRVLKRLDLVVPWPPPGQAMSVQRAGKAPVCAGHNIRWITHPVTGETDSLTGWGKRLGFSCASMWDRVRRYPLDVALSRDGFSHRCGGKAGEGHPWRR